MMTFSDFKIGWRLLITEPAYSAIVVFGMAIGFTAGILLLGYVRYSFSYDSQVPDNKNVYVLQHKVNIMPTPQWMEFMPLPVRGVALQSGLASAVSAAIPIPAAMKVGGRIVQDELTAVDPAFASMWGVTAVEGDLQSALTHPDAIALTVSLAKKLYGDANVIGKTLEIAGKQFQVAALLNDAPPNTTLAYSALVGINTQAITEQDRANRMAQWQGLGGKVYLRLARGANAAQMTAALQSAFDHSPWSQFPPEMLRRLGKTKIVETRLVCLQDAYFNMDVANNYRSGPRASKTTVLALAGIAILILLLAASNFINLATTRTLQRKREIAVRKVLGAKTGQVLSQFLAEAILVSMVATGLGILSAWLLLPEFSDLVDRNLSNFLSPVYLLMIVGMGLVVGLFSGLYPAWIALMVKPAVVLAGRGNSDSSGSLAVQRCLTVFQFAIAMALGGISIAVGWQASFATHSDPGFNPSELVTVKIPRGVNDADRSSFYEQLLHLPGVLGITATQKAVGEQGVNTSTDFKGVGGNTVASVIENVAPNFFEVYGLKPLSGRLFDTSIERDETAAVAVINSTAARAYGFASPEAALGQLIQQTTGEGKTWKVIGIAPDIRYQNLREVVQPMVYLLGSTGSRTLTVKTDGDITQLEQNIETLWQKKFPALPLEIRRTQDVFAEIYAEDLRLARMTGLASLIALGLAVFGIYALSATSLQRRRREIVLRKLYGATRQKIAGLVARDFSGLIATGALIGLPPAFVVIAHYLSGFVERAPFGVWPLVFAFMLVFIVAFAATLRHTLIAMRMNPAQALII